MDQYTIHTERSTFHLIYVLLCFAAEISKFTHGICMSFNRSFIDGTRTQKSQTLNYIMYYILYITYTKRVKVNK